MSIPSLRQPVRAVLTGGLLAGALDITAALVVHGVRGASPLRVLQSIASGWLGVAAFQGGARTAALGLASHFFIATVAAWVYYLGSLRLPVLTQRPVASGALYGVAVFVVMTHVVLPLSNVPRRPLGWGLAAIILAVHVVCVGWPIAWAVRRYGGCAER